MRNCPDCGGHLRMIPVTWHSGRTDYKCTRCGAEFAEHYDSLTGGHRRSSRKGTSCAGVPSLKSLGGPYIFFDEDEL